MSIFEKIGVLAVGGAIFTSAILPGRTTVPLFQTFVNGWNAMLKTIQGR